MTTLIPKFDLKNGGSTPTGAINRPINEKLSESVSILDFGADPTGASDSTTAIQNAINSCVTNKTSLYVPKGTYNYTASSPFTIDLITGASSLVMYGDGVANSIFNINANNVVFNVLTSYYSPLIVSNIKFNLLNPTTNNNATFFYITNGIQYGARFKFDDCIFYGATNCGIQAIRAFNSSARNCLFQGNSIYSSTSGILTTYDDAGIRLWGADGTLTVQDHSFSNLCRIENCSFQFMRYGIEGWGMYLCSISTCRFENVWIGLINRRNLDSAEGGMISSAIKSGYAAGFLYEDTSWFEQIAKWCMSNKDINPTTGNFVNPSYVTPLIAANGGVSNYLGGPVDYPSSYPALTAASGCQFQTSYMDDYQYGTFTPYLNDATYTYGTVSASYIRIGKMVQVQFYIEVTGVSSPTASGVNIINMPFICDNFPYSSSYQPVSITNLNSDKRQVGATMLRNTTNLNLIGGVGSTGSAVTLVGGDITSSTKITGTVSYSTPFVSTFSYPFSP